MNPRPLTVYTAANPALQEVEWHTAALFARMGFAYAMPRRTHIENLGEEVLVLILKTKEMSYTERAMALCRLRKLRHLRMFNAHK